MLADGTRCCSRLQRFSSRFCAKVRAWSGVPHNYTRQPSGLKRTARLARREDMAYRVAAGSVRSVEAYGVRCSSVHLALPGWKHHSRMHSSVCPCGDATGRKYR